MNNLLQRYSLNDNAEYLTCSFLRHNIGLNDLIRWIIYAKCVLQNCESDKKHFALMFFRFKRSQSRRVNWRARPSREVSGERDVIIL